MSIFKSGNNNNKSMKLLIRGSGIIGRDEKVEYVIPDESISRKHCEVTLKEGVLRLKDLGSKNGTFVNKTRIKETILVESDIVRIGVFCYEVKKEDDLYILVPGHSEEMADIADVKSSPIKNEHSQAQQGKEDTIQIHLDFEKAHHDENQIEPLRHDSEKELKKWLTEFKRKTGCHALFLIELGDVGSVIREEVITGKYILSNSVISFMRERMLAERIMKNIEHLSTMSQPIQGVWAPKELKEESMSLLGTAEWSIFCAPIWIQNDKQVLLYAYWRGGCLSPQFVNDLLQQEGAALGSLAYQTWNTLDRMEQQDRNLEQLSEPLIGHSAAFRNVVAQIYKIAMTDFSIVLLGNRGSGKTTIAHAIHELSHRKEHPFKSFNCSNFQAQLVETELFGSRRGAYTDAIDRKGHLLDAHGGTIFIDSLESCPIEVQTKLRDVLEGRSFRAVGGDIDELVDVRFLAALNEDPVVLLQENRIRPDFWDRIGVQCISIPPLWKRVADISELAFYFLERERSKCIRPSPLKGFSPEGMKALQSYYWPGNVRELCNVISRLLIQTANEIASEEDVINAINLFSNQKEFASMKSIFALPYPKASRIFETLYAQQLLEEACNNKKKAAELSGLTRKAFYELLKRCGLLLKNS